MKFYPVGTVVELLSEYALIYFAEEGARGIIEGRVCEEGFNYYQILWDKKDPRVNGQLDGLVDCHHVKISSERKSPKKQAEWFAFSRNLGIKTLSDEKISAFLLIAVKDDIPYIVTDAKTPKDALKIIPDILSVANQLVETCIQTSIETHDTIEKLKDIAEKSLEDEDE